MGTQFQRLTTPRAWILRRCRLTRHGTWKLTMSFPRPGCSCPSGFRRTTRPREEQHVWPWQPKRDPDRHRPLCPQLSPSGSPLPCCGFGPGTSWDLTLTLTLPRSETLHQNLSLPRSLALQLSRFLAWALTSALEGDHETGVASALATSLARTLTLAKALPSWGHNSNV